jgi:hypothetical protein
MTQLCMWECDAWGCGKRTSVLKGWTTEGGWDDGSVLYHFCPSHSAHSKKRRKR